MRSRRGIGRVFVASLGWSVATLAAPSGEERASADPIRVVLSETLPEECATTKPLFDRVRSRTDRIQRVTGDADASVRVVVRRERERVLGELTLEEEAGRTERFVSAPTCDDVIAAFAVMLVVALDPEAESRPPSQPPPPAQPPASAPPAVRKRARPPPRRAPLAPTKEPPAIGLRGGIGYALPAYDGLVFEHSAVLELHVDTALRPRVRAAVARSAHHEVLTTSDRVDLVWTTGRASFCAGPGWLHEHQLALCAGASVGGLDATVERPGGISRRLLWVTAGPSAVLGIELGWRVRLELEAGVSVPALRDRFFFEPATLAYSAPLALPFVGMSLLGDFFRSRDRVVP